MAAIPIVLYQNTQILNSPYRTFTNPLSISGFPREDLDPIDPEITVEYNAAIMAYNYAYIAEYGRYYYFLRMPTVEGQKMLLHLHADAFYNYKNLIMRSQCIAERSSSHYNQFLPDSAIIEEEGYIYNSGVLPYTFKPNNGSYVLTVCGGN